MSIAITFASLCLFVACSCWAVRRAGRIGGGEDPRETVESLRGLCAARGMTTDERRAVTAIVETRLQRLA